MRPVRAGITGVLREETGSILPLIVGYAVLAGSLLVVTADLTSLHIAQKQTEALADAAALAAADAFSLAVDADGVQARLEVGDATRAAEAVLEASPHDATLTRVSVDDAVTARVVVSTVWHPPIGSVFVPDGVTLGAVGTGRTALG